MTYVLLNDLDMSVDKNLDFLHRCIDYRTYSFGQIAAVDSVLHKTVPQWELNCTAWPMVDSGLRQQTDM